MKKYLMWAYLIFIIPFVFSESPPAIPMEIWGAAVQDGSPVVNGLAVNAIVDNVNYAQTSSTKDGYFDVIVINGDRPLTYNDDPTCAAHTAKGEACVPCIVGYGPDHPGQELQYCIEGPQDGKNIRVYIDNKMTMPIVIWNNGSVLRQDLVVITGSVINFSITLTPGWNLISVPLLPIDSSINVVMKGCNYNRIWEFQSDQTWKTSDIDLKTFGIQKGYWVDRVGLTGDCKITIEGTIPSSTNINVNPSWTLVGYPSITPKTISSLIPSSLYNRIWEFQSDQTWKTSDIDLTMMVPGKGYWIDTKITGSYNITN